MRQAVEERTVRIEEMTLRSRARDDDDPPVSVCQFPVCPDCPVPDRMDFRPELQQKGMERERGGDALRGGRLVQPLHATVHSRLEEVGVVLNLGHQGLGFRTQWSWSWLWLFPHSRGRRVLLLCVLAARQDLRFSPTPVRSSQREREIKHTRKEVLVMVSRAGSRRGTSLTIST